MIDTVLWVICYPVGVCVLLYNAKQYEKLERKPSSAQVASGRLRAIIKADREAVPCGRWAQCKDRRGVLPVRFSVGDGPIMTGLANKSCYRYEEVRR